MGKPCPQPVWQALLSCGGTALPLGRPPAWEGAWTPLKTPCCPSQPPCPAGLEECGVHPGEGGCEPTALHCQRMGAVKPSPNEAARSPSRPCPLQRKTSPEVFQ